MGAFVVLFWLLVGNERFRGAVLESLALAKWYAREHVLLCLVPAFFIAGAISVFVSQAAVMKYLGARANKVLAIDGCPTDCARKTLERVGIEGFLCLRITELGIAKGKTPVTDEVIAKVAAAATEKLA